MKRFPARGATSWWDRYGHINWAIADQAIVSGANFVIAVVLARSLGLEEFGRFSIAWIWVLFFVGLQHSLVTAPMMSIAPKQNDDDLPCYYGAVFVQQGVCALLFFLSMLFVVWTGGLLMPEWGVDSLALPMAFAALGHQTQSFLRRYFFVRQRPLAAFANDAATYLGQPLALLLLAQAASLSPERALWVLAMIAGLTTLVGAVFVERLVWDTQTVLQTFRRHWLLGQYLALSGSIDWIKNNLSIAAAGLLLGPSAVGALEVSRRIMGILHVMFYGLENVVPSRAAWHLHQRGMHGLNAYLGKVAWRMGLVTAAVAIAVGVIPGFWLQLFFGSDFAEFGDLLRWYAAAYLVMGFGLPLFSALRALENTRPILMTNLIATLFNVAIYYPLLIWLGLSGVVVGFLANHVVHKALLFRAFIATQRSRED